MMASAYNLTGLELAKIHPLLDKAETLTDFVSVAVNRAINSRRSERGRPETPEFPKVLVCRYNLVDGEAALPFDSPITARFSWHEAEASAGVPLPDTVFDSLRALANDLPQTVLSLPLHVTLLASDTRISAITQSAAKAFDGDIDRSRAWMLVVAGLTTHEGYGDIPDYDQVVRLLEQRLE
jgi:hypothetical protein